MELLHCMVCIWQGSDVLFGCVLQTQVLTGEGWRHLVAPWTTQFAHVHVRGRRLQRSPEGRPQQLVCVTFAPPTPKICFSGMIGLTESVYDVRFSFVSLSAGRPPVAQLGCYLFPTPSTSQTLPSSLVGATTYLPIQ